MKTFYVTSADGKTKLACYRSECKNPTALLQISHGMCEYFNRYAEFAAYMARRGVLVFGHDHLGHGASAATEADLGFTAEGGGADALVEDVHFLSLRMKMEYPNTPLVLFGHSMGSFIAREAVARHPEVYRAAIFCGTGGHCRNGGRIKTARKQNGQRYVALQLAPHRIAKQFPHPQGSRFSAIGALLCLQPPVWPQTKAARFKHAAKAALQFLYMAKNALFPQRDGRKVKQLPKLHLINLRRYFGVREQGLYFGSKEKTASTHGVKEGLYPQAITGKKDLIRPLLAHGESKNAVKTCGAFLPPHNITPQHRFGVTRGFKNGAFCRKFTAQLCRIVKFSVIDNGIASLPYRNAHGLLAALRVHHR